MTKKIIIFALSVMMMLSFVACNKTQDTPVEPATANAIINTDGDAVMGTDADGNSIIQNLKDGDYVEWIIDIPETNSYNIEMVYAGDSEEYSCSIELYSSDGKLSAEKSLSFSGTGANDVYESISEEIGELETGKYTFIIRPNNTETKSFNIKSAKLIP